jgi:hypothetical protein
MKSGDMTMSEIDSNPALIANRRIKDFDALFSSAGVGSVSQLAAETTSKQDDPILEALQSLLTKKWLSILIKHYAQILDIVADIVALVDEDAYFSEMNLPKPPKLGHDQGDNILCLAAYVVKVGAAIKPLVEDGIAVRNQQLFYSTIEKKKKDLAKGFYYEFTDGDLSRIQELINELRNKITQSPLFENGHRERLLRRLERLQSELHKKMSDVDRIWGLVGDAGVAIGKFGKDAKPIVDLIKELSQIAWRTQARKEELPSNCDNPLLGGPES